MNKIPILLLADATDFSADFFDMVVQGGFPVSKVDIGDEATEPLSQGRFDLVILAGALSVSEVSDLLIQIKTSAGEVPVLFATPNPSMSEAVQLVKEGIVDYLGAPLNIYSLHEAIAKALPKASSPRKIISVNRQKGLARIVGNSKKIEKVVSLVKKICDTDTTVLLYGESGTGKELIAQALHYESLRRKGHFVPVNCGAIPGELLESELFGHEKGAFTHAIRSRVGRFELADGGTIFLDEISEMSPMLQVKILRVLQEKRFERIGGIKTIKSDFRVIAATNRDLDKEVAEGRFREDLYYRLNVIPIEAPTLRERVSDIPLLISSFIKKINHSKKKSISGFEPDAMEVMLNYSWPGNVRELENVVERVVILAEADKIPIEELPEKLLGECGRFRERAEAFDEIPDQGFSLSKVVTDFEKRIIVQALDQKGWVKNRAAKLLDVNRTTLLEKMKRYQITPSE